MKRFFPGGLTGRISLILATGLLSAQAIALWLFVHDRVVTSMKVFSLSFADQVVTLTDVLDEVPDAEKPKLFDALNGPLLQVGISQTPLPPPKRSAWHAEEIEQMIRVHLQSRLGQSVEIQLLDRWSPPPLNIASSDPLLPNRQILAIALQQPDDSWLIFVTPANTLSLRRSWHLWLSIVAISIAILISSLWAARRETRPIAQFAAAAERFGQDINSPPLPKAGSKEIQQAIRAFNKMQTQLRELVNSRTLMLAALSHDLRTVLTRLKLRAEFIDNPQQTQKAIADIDQMQAMLDETLAFAKEELATETPVKFDIAESLQSLRDDFTDTGKSVTYTGVQKLAYVGQPTALSRAFMNLISNAITYGQIAEVELLARKTTIEVTIGDRGDSIPDEQKEAVFTPFFRLESSRNRETGGTGLGLTIAKQVIQRHSGTLTLINRIGGGLKVVVILPVPNPAV